MKKGKGLEHLSTIHRKLYDKIQQSNENSLIRNIYENIEIEETDNDEASIIIKNPILNRYFQDELKRNENLSTDITQLNHSILISLVTSFELLVSDIFKDFLTNVDKSNLLEKRSIQFTDLLKIGSVHEAREFLLDQYIEELIRGSFESWVKAIDTTLKINLNQINTIRDNNDIEIMQETFQRRHLLVHNDGVVNDLYLSKIDPRIVKVEKKGEKLSTTPDYIKNRILIFQKVGGILVYRYATTKYRAMKNKYFEKFNDILLSLAVEGCEGSRYIYREIMNDDGFDHEAQLYSSINYYLSYKFNDEFELVRSEVEDFRVETLSEEYKMAKNILLDNVDQAIENFKNYTYKVSDDDFLHIIDWPLIKLIRDHEEIQSLLLERIEGLRIGGSNK